MNCLRCGRYNEKSAKFCEHCGAKLLVACPNCGNTDIASKKFCPQCGTHLALIFLTESMKDNVKVKEINDLDLDAELRLYKKEAERGAMIVTCIKCQTKNRVPGNRKKESPKCGKCGAALPL